MDDTGTTKIVLQVQRHGTEPEARHFLIYTEEDGTKRWVMLSQSALSIGRSAPADIVVADGSISRMHCRLELVEDYAYVTDLGSTNGTYVEGNRITAPTRLRSGTSFRLGGREFGYERRLRGEAEDMVALERDLQSASRYVQMLLPRPIHGGPVEADWHFFPCARVGGDAFGYGPIDDTVWGGFIFDVTGHGAAAALHAVTVLDVLRRRALPGVDLRNPADVITRLNDMFQADSSEVPLFSIWGFTFDTISRELRYCSAGHHPGVLFEPAAAEPTMLNTSQPLVGMLPGRVYTFAHRTLPPGARLYLFSDGMFEITTPDDRQLSFADFLLMLQEVRGPDQGEPQRIFQRVRNAAKPGPLPDDCSILVMTFA